ncbi:hypothetical protein HK102_004330 [Quaeritorhiza haematococci]|nr:hypothetical protein HK102_004330 [Quaeritorhiza haematococci]
MNLSDEQVRKVFIETQAKLTEYSRQLGLVKSQLQVRDRERRINDLTSKELSALDKDVNTYKSVGKMFVLTDVNVLLKELKVRKDDADRECKSLERAATKIERDIVDCQGHLKEMLRKRQG